MNASGTIFIAALNGSALAVGAELAWACDLRIMADGDFVIGLSEVLLALTPGGGGSQRLPRLIGTQQALVAVLEGGHLHKPRLSHSGRSTKWCLRRRCSRVRWSAPSI